MSPADVENMMSVLSAPQRVYLRSLARNLRPAAQVGKAGLEPGVIAHVRALLERQELVKLRLLSSAGEDRRLAAQELAQACKAEMVDLVGRSVVLYRPNRSLPAHRRVELPRA
jgi:RNA-binding protein